MKKIFIILCVLLISNVGFTQLTETTSFDSVCGHPTEWDDEEQLLSWYEPDVPGAGFSHVAKLASEFVKNVGYDDTTGLKLYYISCCFTGPHAFQEDWVIPSSGMAVEDWMHNPACVFAGMVHSLADHYYSFTGEREYIDIVGEMLDYQLEKGTTPEDFSWASVPYASSDPWDTIYQGSIRWQHEDMRGDGRYGIEPDKVGELGYAYLIFYEITLEEKYLSAAISCADALAKHIRDTVLNDNGPFIYTQTNKSPWPFRVHAKTNEEISEYTSNVVEPIKLFNELLRLENIIGLSPEKMKKYTYARDAAWKWLYSRSGPVKTYVWNGYFEDIPNDEHQTNRIQVTPMELAKYVMENPRLDSKYKSTIPALLTWVKNTFQDGVLPGIREQSWCYPTMGSHTSRYGATCAMWYEMTGDEYYKDEAFHHLNYATYMTYDNGVVAVGHDWLGSWWSDGYGDYIRHFFDAIGAIPEWAPRTENHLVKTSSVIQDIVYGKKKIEYKTFDKESKEVLRLVAKPSKILIDGKEISKNQYSWKAIENEGGILIIDKKSGNNVIISL